MTEEGRPRDFALDSRNGLLKIERVSLHHRLEADADGRIRQHVWIEGEATREADCDEISADLEFVLWDGDDELGTCRLESLTLDGEASAKPFTADSDLRVGQGAEVTAIDLRMTVATTKRCDAVRLEPA